MTTGDVIILVVIGVVALIDIVLRGYFSKKAENFATKQDSFDITYESEKGKNLATKEDIQEITKLVESIKTEVSFENQRKHNFIEKRTELFLSVLSHAEDIQGCAFLLWIYVQSQYNEDRIYSLIQRVNDDIRAITHDSRIIMVSYFGPDRLQELTDLANLAFKHGREVCANASNAASAMTTIRNLLQLHNNKDIETPFISEAAKYNKVLEDLRKKLPFTLEEEFVSKMSDYVLLLQRLFNKEFHLRYTSAP